MWSKNAAAAACLAVLLAQGGAVHAADVAVIASTAMREVLDELGLSQAEFARTIGVSPMRVSHVVRGTRPVTAELALLFWRALGQSPQYWLKLQAAYDLKVAEQAIGARLKLVPELG